MPGNWNLLQLGIRARWSGGEGTIVDYWTRDSEIVGYRVEQELEEAERKEAERKGYEVLKKNVPILLDDPELEPLGP